MVLKTEEINKLIHIFTLRRNIHHMQTLFHKIDKIIFLVMNILSIRRQLNVIKLSGYVIFISSFLTQNFIK